MTAPDPRLGEIEGRLSKATPGPWVLHDMSDAVYSPDDNSGWWWVWQESRLPYYGGVMEPTDRSPNDGSIGYAAIDDNRTGVQEKADAEFIAAAPADVAYLLAELRKAQDALGRVEGLHFAEGDADHSYADICFECRDTYPCPTIDALRAAVAAATGGGE